MKVLLIKMTSMGDVIHLFPALTDAVKHVPSIQFDWVIEKSFQELPLWHDSVTKVIPVAFRQWKKKPLKMLQDVELKKLYSDLREQEYDFVIDAQGLLKSAIVSSVAKGKRIGLDIKSVREKSATAFYQQRHHVNPQQHAVTRMRELFAKTFSYALPATKPDYGLKFQATEIAKPFLFFFHGTTWENKHWPELYWRELTELATKEGFVVYLPWGNETEKQRAERVAAELKNVHVLPKMSLTQIAELLVNAAGVVAVDTGLAHLAAALAIPTVSLYGPTNPMLTGTMGENQIHMQANFACSPCLKRKCFYKGATEQQPACFTTLPANEVWQQLLRQLLS